MPTTIAIESKPVVLFGLVTPYDHLYLVKTITDASGRVIDERVIRGNLGDDGTLETQADIPLALSEDSRGSDTPAQRHHTVLNLNGRNPEEVWDVMVQHAVNIDRAQLRYGVEAFDIDYGGEVNSNTTIASALHAVGISLAQNLPEGVLPREVPLYNRLDAMLVDDVLIGGAQDDFIFGGVGNDTVNGGGGDDRLFGEIGADSLIGGSGNDRLDGGIGADFMAGGAGNDYYFMDSGLDRVVETSTAASGGVDLVISTFGFSLAARAEMTGVERLMLRGTGEFAGGGNNLNNTIIGNGSDNNLAGRNGNDLLIGNAGEDSLYGGAGIDTLRGGDGDDLLTGGVNRDIFRAGLGSDTFVYKSIAESYAGAATRDGIADFEDSDRIDLSAIDSDLLVGGNQSFSLIGSAAFTGPGQLRFQLDGAGNTIIQANVDGDLSAELEIFLRGYTQPLNGGDFVL